MAYGRRVTCMANTAHGPRLAWQIALVDTGHGGHGQGLLTLEGIAALTWHAIDTANILHHPWKIQYMVKMTYHDIAHNRHGIR